MFDKKERAKLVNAVLANGYRKASEESGITIANLRTIVGECDAFKDAVRAKARAFLEKNPECGPATFASKAGIDPRVVRKCCQGIFKPPAERVPIEVRKHIRPMEIKRVAGNNSYRILLLLINGVEISDITAGIGCSAQLVYQVRDDAIEAGFTFL